MRCDRLEIIEHISEKSSTKTICRCMTLFHDFFFRVGTSVKFSISSSPLPFASNFQIYINFILRQRDFDNTISK